MLLQNYKKKQFHIHHLVYHELILWGRWGAQWWCWWVLLSLHLTNETTELEECQLSYPRLCNCLMNELSWNSIFIPHSPLLDCYLLLISKPFLEKEKSLLFLFGGCFHHLTLTISMSKYLMYAFLEHSLAESHVFKKQKLYLDCFSPNKS